MTAGDVALLAWNDYVGITRCRGIPAEQLPARMAHGLGWAVAGQAMTPFSDIAPNPWGPMLEVRQVPIPETGTRVDIWPDAPAFHLYLCDARTADGADWDCSTRGFLTRALAELHAATGLTLKAAFEHEFLLVADDLDPAPAFTVEAMRLIAPLAGDLALALHEAGLEPETVEPEYGVGQYEVTTAPALGVSAGDRAVLTREVIREAARRRGMRACFSPKPDPSGVGNGSHVHFSLIDDDGRNVTHDPAHPSGVSAVAQAFIAGVVRHMPALCALVAPSPVSYLRLGPHHWSCGFASFGIQNREAAIRVCPSTDPDPVVQARTFNLEFRPPDPSASPYLVLGALVHAGLAGIRDGLPLPPACEGDPADLTPQERAQMGIRELPATLTAALDALVADDVAAGWLPPVMLESYLSVKRTEVDVAAAWSSEELCAQYARVY
jgi:glutamine synthetase